MPIDPKMKEAINVAIQNAGQKEELSNRIVAWINSLIAGNVDITNDEDALRHLELIYKEVELDGE